MDQFDFQVLRRNGNLVRVGPPDMIERMKCSGDEVTPAVVCGHCGTAWADQWEVDSCPCLDE